ncbi:hypothetical protein [Clostridium botulinum]|uniref:hypothetical protein n=1 Tax=Clostridium botulinum TaxID=1491 RepID=UPI001E4B8A64|nr:hypothetical protein [Clostridium botulinum]MCD3223962.1 hypothetical protein [Clostridium botulinum C/D]MCD3298233.1 hypothetical protein [Clostridium botulinum C/D]
MKARVIDKMLKKRGFRVGKEYEVVDRVYLNDKVFLYIVKNDEGKAMDVYPKSVELVK